MTLLFLLAITTLCFAQDPRGWGGLQWGFSTAEAQAVFKTAERPAVPETDYELDVLLKLPRVQVADFTGHASLAYRNLKLAAIDIFVDDIARAAVFERLKQELTVRYGKAASGQDEIRERRSVTRSVLWTVGSTAIQLKWTEYGDLGLVSVRYAEITGRGL